jgi:hypothetical protein
MNPTAATLTPDHEGLGAGVAAFAWRLDRASATARIDIIHLIRISTDREINVAVKPERLCLRDDRHF